MKNQKQGLKKNKRVYDFKCSCGCGQKLRVSYFTWKDGYVIDFGIMQPKEKKPKVGVVLRSDEKDSLKEFLRVLPKL